MATNRNKSCCQVAPSIISDSAQEKSFITEENSFVTDSMLYNVHYYCTRITENMINSAL